MADQLGIGAIAPNEAWRHTRFIDPSQAVPVAATAIQDGPLTFTNPHTEYSVAIPNQETLGDLYYVCIAELIAAIENPASPGQLNPDHYATAERVIKAIIKNPEGRHDWLTLQALHAQLMGDDTGESLMISDEENEQLIRLRQAITEQDVQTTLCTLGQTWQEHINEHAQEYLQAQQQPGSKQLTLDEARFLVEQNVLREFHMTIAQIKAKIEAPSQYQTKIVIPAAAMAAPVAVPAADQAAVLAEFDPLREKGQPSEINRTEEAAAAAPAVVLTVDPNAPRTGAHPQPSASPPEATAEVANTLRTPTDGSRTLGGTSGSGSSGRRSGSSSSSDWGHHVRLTPGATPNSRADSRRGLPYPASGPSPEEGSAAWRAQQAAQIPRGGSAPPPGATSGPNSSLPAVADSGLVAAAAPAPAAAAAQSKCGDRDSPPAPPSARKDNPGQALAALLKADQQDNEGKQNERSRASSTVSKDSGTSSRRSSVGVEAAPSSAFASPTDPASAPAAQAAESKPEELPAADQETGRPPAGGDAGSGGDEPAALREVTSDASLTSRNSSRSSLATEANENLARAFSKDSMNDLRRARTPKDLRATQEELAAAHANLNECGETSVRGRKGPTPPPGDTAERQIGEDRTDDHHGAPETLHLTIAVFEGEGSSSDGHPDGHKVNGSALGNNKQGSIADRAQEINYTEFNKCVIIFAAILAFSGSGGQCAKSFAFADDGIDLGNMTMLANFLASIGPMMLSAPATFRTFAWIFTRLFTQETFDAFCKLGPVKKLLLTLLTPLFLLSIAVADSATYRNVTNKYGQELGYGSAATTACSTTNVWIPVLLILGRLDCKLPTWVKVIVGFFSFLASLINWVQGLAIYTNFQDPPADIKHDLWPDSDEPYVWLDTLGGFGSLLSNTLIYYALTTGFIDTAINPNEARIVLQGSQRRVQIGASCFFATWSALIIYGQAKDYDIEADFLSDTVTHAINGVVASSAVPITFTLNAGSLTKPFEWFLMRPCVVSLVNNHGKVAYVSLQALLGALPILAIQNGLPHYIALPQGIFFISTLIQMTLPQNTTRCNQRIDYQETPWLTTTTYAQHRRRASQGSIPSIGSNSDASSEDGAPKSGYAQPNTDDGADAPLLARSGEGDRRSFWSRCSIM